MISSKHLQWIRDFANGTPPSGPMLFPERLWKARLLDPLLPHPSLLHLYERCSHDSIVMKHKDPENRA